ncbi:MAG TPA: BrnT family toxin [Chloroflexota bacterium]|nr:BrnT family toxin [Chloroflexota bacterium]
MVDWGGFDWDDGNSDKNLVHGVSDDEIEEVFLNEEHRLLVRYLGDQRGEPRYRALGRADAGRYLFVAFTFRRRDGTRLIRPISARDMTPSERRQYTT